MKIENLSSKTSCLKHRMQVNLRFTIKRKIFKLVLYTLKIILIIFDPMNDC